MPRNTRAYVMLKSGEKILVKESFEELYNIFETRKQNLIVHSKKDDKVLVFERRQVELIGQLFFFFFIYYLIFFKDILPYIVKCKNIC